MAVSTRGAQTFMPAYLKLEANVWHHLLKSKLLPTTYDALITKERVHLLFCIIEGRPVN